MKYKVTRVWDVDAINIKDAIKKSKNWKHTSIDVTRIYDFDEDDGK